MGAGADKTPAVIERDVAVKGADLVHVVPAPGIRIVDITIDGHEVERSPSHWDPTVRVRWRHAPGGDPPETIRLRISLDREGEVHVRPLATPEVDWKRVLERRGTMNATAPPPHLPALRMLHAIDSETNPKYIPYAGSLSCIERPAHLQIVAELLGQLSRRMEHRFQGWAVTAGYSPKYVGFIAMLLRGTMREQFQDDPAGIPRAFQQFAAGHLRQTITIDGRTLEKEADVDSTAVFMFAELALVAIDCDIEPVAWRALLPCFVSMQHLYIERWGPDRPPGFTDDGWERPPPPLDDEKRFERILNRYPRRQWGRRTLEKMIKQNMDRAADVWETALAAAWAQGIGTLWTAPGE